MLVDAFLRKRGVRANTQIALHAAEPVPMPVAGPAAGAQIRAMLDRRGIGYVPAHQASHVEQGALHFSDGQVAAFDLLLCVPPHRAPAVVRDAGLCGESGWVPVDRDTLATKFAGVRAIGDVTAIPLKMGRPLPKAGVLAGRQAEVVASNLAAAWNGRAAKARFDGQGMCFRETGRGHGGRGQRQLLCGAAARRAHALAESLLARGQDPAPAIPVASALPTWRRGVKAMAARVIAVRVVSRGTPASGAGARTTYRKFTAATRRPVTAGEAAQDPRARSQSPRAVLSRPVPPACRKPAAVGRIPGRPGRRVRDVRQRAVRRRASNGDWRARVPKERTESLDGPERAAGEECVMTSSTDGVVVGSRRRLVGGSTALLVGGGIGSAMTSLVRSAAAQSPAEAPPLPWKWVRLDPLEAGRRAYRFYKEKGGCGTASYLSLLSLLKEKAGYPWTTMPDFLMAHAAAGYGGHGTLCGALGGASTIINMVAYGGRKDEQQNNQIIDRLFWWYAEQDFPTERFDDLSPLPKQVRVKAMSPLCHTSVSKWAVAAGATIKSDAKIERCAKVAGEVAHTVTLALNEFFDGKWKPPVWKPAKGIEHCVGCHGPDTAAQKAMAWNQQGHMECVACHADHTRATTK